MSVTFSCAIGVILGCIAGFYNQKVDNFIMRVVDVLLAIPNILLALSIATALDPGLMNLIIAVGIGAIPGYAASSAPRSSPSSRWSTSRLPVPSAPATSA